MTEDEIRSIVRDEIALALRAAEVDGPHMARFNRTVAVIAEQVAERQCAVSASASEARRYIRQGARPEGRSFVL